MAQRIEDILDNCLERISKGESIEDCLKTYSEQASDLEPLLETSFAFMQKSAAIQPDYEFKTRTRFQLQEMLYARREKTEMRKTIPFWRRRWVAAVASVIVILFAGIGTVAVSASALPEQTLYPVKLATERMMIGLAFSDVNRAKLHIQFAQRRTGEMVEMARQGEDNKTFFLAEEATVHIDQLEKIVEADNMLQAEDVGALAPAWEAPAPVEPAAPEESALPQEPSLSLPPAPSTSSGTKSYGEAEDEDELAAMLSRIRAGNLAKLEIALEKAPEELKPSLEQAIRNVTQDYDETLLCLES
ncbi:MAG: hypothetical protein JW732_02220 [Dehalococcoidia bacterium]|nr:hypothetical protein [Dehalococcoidia bacterium]